MKKLVAFVIVMFVATFVSFGQTKKEVSSSAFSEISLKPTQRSSIKFNSETADNNKDLRKFFFKSAKLNLLLYIGKDNKVSYAGSQTPNGGTMQINTLNGFLECCAIGFSNREEIVSVVINCAKTHLDISLQPVP